MSSASAELGDILHDERVILDQNNDNVSWNWNPLDCVVCRKQLVQPVTLPSCAHAFCRSCLAIKEESRVRCPLCGVQSILSKLDESNEPAVDELIQFLIDTTNEKATTCANCDKALTPMFFCETCHQALCDDCKERTHQARMFASHRIVKLEERAVLRSRADCAVHEQPLILFSTDTKQLMCIKCFRAASLQARPHYVDLDVAHKLGGDKLERNTTKLKKFQEELKERITSHRRFLDELDSNCSAQRAHVQQTCQQMVDCLMQVRDKLIDQLETERQSRQQLVTEQLRLMYSTLPNVQLLLLCAQIFASSASVLDFLHLVHDLTKRMQTLTSDSATASSTKVDCAGQLLVNCKDEFAHALEPYLGISSLLLPPAMIGPGESGQNGSGSNGFNQRRTVRSGSGYVNLPGGSAANWAPVSKYQLMVDLAGAFGDEFAKIDDPITEFTTQMADVSRRAQDMQRDMTVRRVIIDEEKANALIGECSVLEQRLQAHTILIQQLQPQLQQIWQEELDRVRRQQQLYRRRVECCVQLRNDVQLVSRAAAHLRPFVHSLAATAITIDPRRTTHNTQTAPMEMICKEIGSLAPDSTKRVDAIEKEAEQRRVRSEQERQKAIDQIMSVKKQLKTTSGSSKQHKDSSETSTTTGGGGGGQHQHRKLTKQQLARMTARERSRGGTDPTLMLVSPQKAKHKGHPPRPPSSTNTSTDQESSIMSDEASEAMDRLSLAPTPPPSTSPLNCHSPTPTNKLTRSRTLRASDLRHTECAMSATASVTIVNNNNNVVPPTTATTISLNTLSSSLPNDTSCLIDKDREGDSTQSVNPPPRPHSFAQAGSGTVSSPTTIIPAAPVVPTGWWAGFRPGVSVELSTLEAREQMLRSLKERVPRIDVGATKSPDREVTPKAETTESVSLAANETDEKKTA